MHVLVGQGRFAEAHSLVSDAFVERNGSAGYLLRAWVLTQERRPAEAREAVDWALAIAGPAEAADVFVLAGVVLLSLDEAHAALTVALRAAGSDPDGWEPSVLLSDVYRRLGRVPDAVAAARRAVAVAPYEAEAQVALARSLSATRGLTGRPARRHRAEHESAVERALTLGVDPGQLTAPRGGALIGGIGLLLFWGVQLYRMETGDTWQLIAGGAVLTATFVLVAVLVKSGSRRSGISARTRLRGIRATTRTELAGDDWLWRIGAVHVGAALPLPVLLSTGMAADRAWRGHAWPLWATATAAAAGVGAVLVVLLGVRWWYGAWLARRMLRYGRLILAQLVAISLLVGVTLALASRGDVPDWEWAALAVVHLGWIVLGWLGALLLVWWIQVRRRQVL
ncbi:tetratricopeptide repeat protein [Streptomyces sp. NBC_01476]|uniref:tetratricopeptide repeat protein n=1 Tax=Streptomyces sp. NBC_01476 TaxID=2903881 RepID=UPI002E36C56D|nr:tetratricopeptide repeat protein [Streptomyces sp. NBC_01476]